MADKILSEDDKIKEILKCRNSPEYFIENYCKIQHPIKGIIPFKLYDFQKEILYKFQNYRFNIANKSRQTGLSTLTSSYALWLAYFYVNKDIIILSIKDSDAQEFLKKIKIAYEQLPEWMKDEPKTNNMHTIEFNNGSKITSMPSSEQATRGRTPSLLIIDECAFIKNIEDIWTAALPTLSRGGKAILISTPNGVGNFFHEMWEGCQKYTPKDKRNEFEPTFIHWTQIPEYRGFDDTTGMTFKEIVEKAKRSKWYKEIRPNISDRKWNQEYEGDFLGSGNTVIKQKVLKLTKEWVVDPKYQYDFAITPDKKVEQVRVLDGDFWVWKEPVAGEKYILAADVASGDDESDYSAFHVLNVTTGEQCAEYRGRVNTTFYSKIIDHIGRFYNNAFVVVELTGMGIGVLHNLVHELYYPNLYKRRDEETQQIKKMKYGWETKTKTRPLLIQALQDSVEEYQCRFYSIRLWKELSVFVWKNGKAQADGRNNDDLVMAYAMASYLREEAIRCFVPSGLLINKHKNVDPAVESSVNYENGMIIHTDTFETIPFLHTTSADDEDLGWLYK